MAHEQPGDEVRDEGGGRASPRVAFLGFKLSTSNMTWTFSKAQIRRRDTKSQNYSRCVHPPNLLGDLRRHTAAAPCQNIEPLLQGINGFCVRDLSTGPPAAD